MRALGLLLSRIEEPGTLDGGDVLQIGTTVYVGRGGRTNAGGDPAAAAGARRHRGTVVAVPLERVLHLKSAVTALPDGTVLAWGDLVDTGVFPSVRRVPRSPARTSCSSGSIRS